MIKLGIIMDSIKSINFFKDSSLAILLQAQKRNYEIYYMEINSIYLYKSTPKAIAKIINVTNNSKNWFNFYEKIDICLETLDVILMRKDPPVNNEFIYVTQILEHVENKGVLVINKPSSLRNYNEKIFISWFEKYIPNTVVSCSYDVLYDFLQKNNDIIIKPLDGMGGISIFRVTKNDYNISVIIEQITNFGKQLCMAQKYIPEITLGDKRILIINGKPAPYCLYRIPKSGETRANIAAGGYGKVKKLSKNDWKISNAISPFLKKNGLFLVGLDIVGNYLTEINITSPTCICQIEKESSISITKMLLNSIEEYLDI